jgi:hypothetical protein
VQNSKEKTGVSENFFIRHYCTKGQLAIEAESERVVIFWEDRVDAQSPLSGHGVMI